MKEDEQEKEAIEDGQLAVIEDWEELRCRTCRRTYVHHEISHSHFAAGNESGETGQESERNHESADQLNPTSDLHHHGV